MQNLHRILACVWGICFVLAAAVPGAARSGVVGAGAARDGSTGFAFWDWTHEKKLAADLDLWVDGVNGDDAQNGKSALTAFRTIQRAAALAGPGTTVHILPGVYRETIQPAQSGTALNPIRYTAEAGIGTVAVRGSEPASSLTWVQLTSNTIGLPAGVDPRNVYAADLSGWGLSGAPRYVAELDAQGQVSARLPQAREPDWSVVNEWKFHEYWWAADGGSGAAGCYPPTDSDPYNCDAAWRSLTQLTDLHSDGEPAGVEPGNLTTLGSLTGATLVVKDSHTGTFVFRRTVIAHDLAGGRITVDAPCEHGHGTGTPALGWGSKYYLEGLPNLLDMPGEWWYDPVSARLYLWPLHPGSPGGMQIEIARRQDGFVLQDRSFITLDGLVVEFYNRNSVYFYNDSYDQSIQDVIRNSILRYAENGIWIRQYVDPAAPPDRAVDGFTLEDSEIAFMDSLALYSNYSWKGSSAVAAFIRPGVTNTTIRRNTFHHLGFGAESEGVGLQIVFADHLVFEDNYVHHVAHNGVQIMRSVIQSAKTFGFTAAEIKIGDILIRGNTFEGACQNAIDCGALKISGSPPAMQVFRGLLVTGNIFRNTFGWTYIGEKRGHFVGGQSSVVRGMGGFGMYVDNASGIYAYRNIAYNNAYAGFKLSGAWRDGDIIYANNTIADSLYAFNFGGKAYDTHDGSVNTQLVNNIIANHECYGIFLSDADGTFENTILDYNLYFNNGWRPYNQGGEYKPGDIRLDVPGVDLLYQTVPAIQNNTNWEDHAQEGNPVFWDYYAQDHDLFDGSWPAFFLTSSSATALDRGMPALPAGLAALLQYYHLPETMRGAAWDIGRYEAGYDLLASPSARAVNPGGTARYQLGLAPAGAPYTVNLSAISPDPQLSVSVQPASISAGISAALVVTHTQNGPLPAAGLTYTITVTGSGDGFSSVTTVSLLVGKKHIFLPVITRNPKP